ncbi:N-acetylmuramoyl-L-alanine amidase [Paenibacillus algorifonticola]|uniref:peptidoglycan recognition protein family protein n=1 Tax=Paenibacillus algorifonticola TaxID=684063 RepID=UPI003D2C9475
MSFTMKYLIEQRLLPVKTKRRSGIAMNRVGFAVAHDTGNDGSTAAGNVGYYINSANEMSASAHTFIDDKQIIECIPATIGLKEKAWHVLYNTTVDNAIYGADANDVAIGVELCYSHLKGSINNTESYKRYVWYLAYICYKFNLNPLKDIIGHNTLDPKRKVDPTNALSRMGKNFNQLIADVANEYKACAGVIVAYPMKESTGLILCKGSTGEEVRKLQVKLNKLGCELTVDGNFGAETDLAVRALQKSFDVAQDGRVGPLTMARIDAELASIAEKIVKEDDRLLLVQWQVDMLVEALTKLQRAGTFESMEWIEKAKNKTLTLSELAFLNTIILSKGLKAQ